MTDQFQSLREALAKILSNDFGTIQVWDFVSHIRNDLPRLLAEYDRMREALEQAKMYVEADELAHGRQFGTGNAIRAALNQETK